MRDFLRSLETVAEVQAARAGKPLWKSVPTLKDKNHTRGGWRSRATGMGIYRADRLR